MCNWCRVKSICQMNMVQLERDDVFWTSSRVCEYIQRRGEKRLNQDLMLIKVELACHSCKGSRLRLLAMGSEIIRWAGLLVCR